MSLFTSNREKRLWMWTLAVVVAIYSTLGLARTLADQFGNTGLGETLFIGCCLLILVAVVTQVWNRRPSRIEWGVAIGIVATYVLVFARMAVPNERTHLIEYGVVAMLVYEALCERNRQGRPIPFPSLMAVLVTSLIGVTDECIQWLIPSRVFDLQDILFNFVAALMAVASSNVLAWARKRALHRTDSSS